MKIKHKRSIKPANNNLTFILSFFVCVPLCGLLITALPLSCSTGEPETFGAILDFSAAVPQGETVIAGDFAGVCHSGYSNNLDREYGLLHEMGAAWLHRDFSWSTIQGDSEKDKTPDQWNWASFDSYVLRANEEGKKIMGMLLYDVGWVHTLKGHPADQRQIWSDEIPYFCTYAVETVKRYNGKNGHGKVDAWLIWNEPDLNPRFWTGTREEFYELTKATAEAIRELDAEQGTTTTLIGGVFSPMASSAWITGLFDSGAMANVDGVAFHPYGPGALSCAGVFNSFKQRVTPYGFADKIWVNEMGYPSYTEKGDIPAGRYGTDQWEGDMPRVAAQTFTLLAAAGARNLTWYHLFDSADRDNSDSEDWFGLVWQKSDAEWLKKGGYGAYALCAKHIPGKTYKKLQFPGLPADTLFYYYFEGSDGSRTLIVWNDAPLETVKVKISFNGSNHKLWDIETGEPADTGKTSVYTLYPTSGSTPQNALFFTWNE